MRVTIPAKSHSRRPRWAAQLVGLGLTTALAVGFAAPASALQPGPPSGSGVQPDEEQGNATFPELGYTCPQGVRVINNPEVGTNEFTVDGFTVSITVRNTEGVGETFDFDIISDHVALGVLVKGGPNTNEYDYRPSGIEEDTNLHAPLGAGPSGSLYHDISNIEFCLDRDGNQT
ncbi:hypothetical protein SSP24_25370 [Streptomyces spinoverrucosus]|uniref:Uncharacterized protein n=1 Tax=Streptomyces spinoverrucosus TaxID=284043 RepID=A0A4Y3VCI7_9ACTN|nr:hypothetical protein [Streptomyces spinoverrucosus]GEC04882.1 hypothetical protein SSP24_25370 [Streptomyces spinoverrucosus]GHB60370.1 hypothetical protein GCM10010397_33210 [Streptomyces spinoverrucosus]